MAASLRLAPTVRVLCAMCISLITLTGGCSHPSPTPSREVNATDASAGGYYQPLQMPSYVSGVPPLPVDSDDLALNRLAEKRITFQFDQVSLHDMFDFYRVTTGCTLYVNWEALSAVGIDKDKEISCNIGNKDAVAGLRLVLESVGGGETELDFEMRKGVLCVSTKEDLARWTLCRIYDVSDLYMREIYWTVPDDKKGTAVTPANLIPYEKVKVYQGIDQLIELIQCTVDPESWRDAGGNIGTIRPFGQCLVVTQTFTAHRQLRDLLAKLRAAGAHWSPPRENAAPNHNR